MSVHCLITWVALLCYRMVTSSHVCIQLLYSKAGQKDLTYKTVSGSVLFECKALCEMSTICTSFTLGVSDRVCRLNKDTPTSHGKKTAVSQNRKSDQFYIAMDVSNKTAAGPCATINCTDCDADMVYKKTCAKESTVIESSFNNHPDDRYSSGHREEPTTEATDQSTAVNASTIRCFTSTKKGYRAPADGVNYGWQNDGGGHHWSAVAHTKHGHIPGKAKDNSSCWYSVLGSEFVTRNYSWITAPRRKIAPVINRGHPPAGAVRISGEGNIEVDYYACVAVTRHGLIPGKAQGGQSWYGYNRKEYNTTQFLWLVCLDRYEKSKTATEARRNTKTENIMDSDKKNYRLDITKTRQWVFGNKSKAEGLNKCYTSTKNVSHALRNGVIYGWQNDGSGHYWSTVAHTEHGPVAGKAAGNGNCWYTFQGLEIGSRDWSWITAPPGKIAPVINTGSTPPGAVSVGSEENEGGVYYAAVAVTRHGLIPGKAKGNKCWYGYAGKMDFTMDFMWLVCNK